MKPIRYTLPTRHRVSLPYRQLQKWFQMSTGHKLSRSTYPCISITSRRGRILSFTHYGSGFTIPFRPNFCPVPSHTAQRHMQTPNPSCSQTKAPFKCTTVRRPVVTQRWQRVLAIVGLLNLFALPLCCRSSDSILFRS